jgi:hypothetical protein
VSVDGLIVGTEALRERAVVFDASAKFDRLTIDAA